MEFTRTEAVALKLAKFTLNEVDIEAVSKKNAKTKLYELGNG